MSTSRGLDPSDCAFPGEHILEMPHLLDVVATKGMELSHNKVRPDPNCCVTTGTGLHWVNDVRNLHASVEPVCP